jgi:Bacterial transglutaminase-like N-terminal region
MSYEDTQIHAIERTVPQNPAVNVSMHWSPTGQDGPYLSNIADAAIHIGASLITLRLQHKTTYRYRQPVSLGPHRLMLRPRESRDLRLISSDVVVRPPPRK